MNILQVNKFHWLKGGSETACLGLTDLLEKHGHDVAFFSMKHPHNIASRYENYFVENVDYSHGTIRQKLVALSKIVYSFEAAKKMEALLGTIRPQVAHFHIFQHQISPSVFAPLQKRNIPIVLTLHDLKPLCPNYKMLTHDGICERCKGHKFYNCLIHRCTKGSLLASMVNAIEMYFHYVMKYYQSVDKYIAVSEFYRNKMLEFGFPSDKIEVIPNCIDTSRFKAGTDDGYGLFIGRLSEEKGLVTLLHALAKCPQVPFVIAGTGPLEAKLHMMAQSMGLEKVHFAGFKTGRELVDLIENCSFSVIPSEWYENCPMSVLESYAAGKPVIGSNLGGIPELIDDDSDGLLFAAADVNQLAERINRLFHNRPLRVEMGRAGREKIKLKFNPERHYEQTMDIYIKVGSI